MRYNQHNPTMFTPMVSHADLAARLAAIRQEERELGVRYPITTEALIRQWEKGQER